MAMTNKDSCDIIGAMKNENSRLNQSLSKNFQDKITLEQKVRTLINIIVVI